MKIIDRLERERVSKHHSIAQALVNNIALSNDPNPDTRELFQRIVTQIGGLKDRLSKASFKRVSLRDWFHADFGILDNLAWLEGKVQFAGDTVRLQLIDALTKRIQKLAEKTRGWD